jgi:hypothetical protein
MVSEVSKALGGFFRSPTQRAISGALRGRGGSSRRRRRQEVARRIAEEASRRRASRALEEQRILEERQRAEESQRQFELERARAEQERIAQRQRSRRLEEEARRTVSGELQPFSREAFLVPPLTRRQAGAELGFFEATGAFIGREARFALGTPIQEDILGFRGREIPVDIGTSQVLVTEIPTATIIDPRSGIVPRRTVEERGRIEFITAGTGVGIQFEAETIGKELQKGAISRLETGIATGKITTQEQLDIAKAQEEEFIKREFKTRVIRKRAEKERGREFKKIAEEAETFDIAPVLKGGAIAGGLIVAPATTQAALIGTGVLKAGSIFERPKEERIETGIEAGLDIGIGAGVFGTVGRQIQLARAESIVGKTIKSPFREGEFVETFVEIPPRGGIGEIRAVKVRGFEGGVADLGIRGVSPALRRGADIAVLPRGTLRGQVRIPPIDVEGRLAGKRAFDISQEFKTGGLFRITPTQAEGISGFRGRIGTEKEFREVAGITLPRGRDVFRTLSTETFIDVRSPLGRRIILQEPSIGLTRVVRGGRIRRTADIVGGRPMGLPRPTIEQEPLIQTGLTQETISKGISPSLRIETAQVPRLIGGLRPPRTTVITKQMPQEVLKEVAIVQPAFQPVTVSARPDVRTTLAPRTVTGLRVVPTQAQAPALGQIQIPKFEQKLQLEAVTDFAPPTTPPFAPSFAPSFRDARFGFPFFPPIPSGIAELGLGRARKPARRFRRVPSFAAVQLGFEAEKPLPLEFTGLVERPIVRKRRKRK